MAMINKAFFDVVHQTARAAMSGSALPALSGKLLTHLKLIGVFFEGDDVVTVDEGSAQIVILAKDSAQNEAALIDTTATFNADGEYEFEWAVADSVQLRAVLDAAADPTQPMELRYQVIYSRAGEAATIGGPILFENNFFRPETPAPEATLNTSWETLKARLVAGSNITLTANDTAKTITIAGEDSEANAAAITAEATARANADTALQGSIDAEATARANADTALQGNVDAEATARANADTALQGNVDAEATARANADTALQGGIDAEATARANADTALQGGIDAEATARANADTALQGNVDAEATARANADTALQSDVDAKAPKLVPILQPAGTSRTLQLTDAGTCIRLDAITSIIVPLSGPGGVNFPDGTQIMLVQSGASQATISGEDGVTLLSFEGKLKTAGQYAAVTLFKNNTTDNWYVFGNLAA